MSLRVKLIWPYLVVIATIMVINQGYLYYTKQQSLQRELVKEIRLFTHSSSHSIKDGFSSKDKAEAQALLDELLTSEPVYAVQLYRRATKPVILFEKSDGLAPTAKKGERWLASLGSPKSYLYIVEPVVDDGKVIAHLGITFIDSPLFNNIEALSEEAKTVAVLLIILSVLFYLHIGSVVLKPLNRLNVAVQELTHEPTHYSPLHYHSKDEIGTLIYSLDRMMVKLFQREKQRYHSLEVLKQKSSISEDVIESIQYSLIITDSTGTIIQCNSATFQIFEKSRDTLLQSNIRDLIQTKTSTEIQQILDKGIEHNEVRLRSIDNKQPLATPAS